MATRLGPGPVFAAECVTIARRWQVYAGRALLLQGLLGSLGLCWLTWLRHPGMTIIQRLAAIGSAMVNWTMAVELVLALVVVPAVAAGAICQDKMSGALTIMMVTDLSDAEIVLGKLAARLLTVFGVIACTLPVLAITAILGGADPVAIADGSMVIAGVAILGVTLSLFYSVWARKPHEALMATYATYAIWLLALLAWQETFRGTSAPDFLWVTNPFWLIFGDHWARGGVPLLHCAGFLAGVLTLSAALAMISIRSIRRVTLRQAAGPAREPTFARGPIGHWLSNRRSFRWLLTSDPILWREIHRRQRSSSARAIWALYGVISTIFTWLAVFVNDQIAAGVSGFMVSIGLLMVSATAATSLAEERARGSLDVLLTTPLTIRAIVYGKWRGTFHGVKRLAILPAALAFATGLRYGLPAACGCATLAAGLVLAYGAVITSFAQGLAISQPRLGRAVGFSVATYLAMCVVYPTIVITLSRGNGPPSWAPVARARSSECSCSWRCSSGRIRLSASRVTRLCFVGSSYWPGWRMRCCNWLSGRSACGSGAWRPSTMP